MLGLSDDYRRDELIRIKEEDGTKLQNRNALWQHPLQGARAAVFVVDQRKDWQSARRLCELSVLASESVNADRSRFFVSCSHVDGAVAHA